MSLFYILNFAYLPSALKDFVPASKFNLPNPKNCIDISGCPSKLEVPTIAEFMYPFAIICLAISMTCTPLAHVESILKLGPI